MRNNNRQVIRLLSQACYEAARGRGRILMAAVAFTVAALFSVFSLAVGKIEADCLFYERSAATAAHTTLESADEAQLRQIEGLSYVKACGREYHIGEAEHFSCRVLDRTAWEQMQAPAYSDITGSYPKAEDEIMLPVRALAAMGVDQPQIGMEIAVSLTAAEEDADRGRDACGREDIDGVFTLSGYYTEYADPAYAMPAGYFSESFLKERGFAGNCEMRLLIQQQDSLSGEDIEERLYRDVTMRDDSQQFFGGNPMTWQAVYDMTGGFGTAAVLAAVIILSAWLLLYNVIHISLNRDIRQYGLLKTIGATGRQLRAVVFRQTAKIAAAGCGAGAVSGCLAALLILPVLLCRMYLHGLGKAPAEMAFRPWLLVLSVFLGAATLFLSAALAVAKVSSMTAVEALKYTEGGGAKKRRRNAEKKVKKRNPGGPKAQARAEKMRAEETRAEDISEALAAAEKDGFGKSLGVMARRNLLRFRKRFFLTVLSLALSITVAAGAVAVVKGVDQRHRIDYEQADFRIYSNMSALTADQYPEQESFFPESLSRQLADLEGVLQSREIRGAYGKIDRGEEALAVYLEEEAEKGGFSPVTVQIVSNAWLEELKAFAEEKDLCLDVDSVKQGAGMILLHRHRLSQIQNEQGKDAVGKSVAVSGLDGQKKAQMSFSGYLDFDRKGLPALSTTWNSGGIVYFLVSEKGFARLHLPPQIFELQLEAEPEWEPRLKAVLTRIIGEFNRGYTDPSGKTPGYVTDNRTLALSAKSDALEAAEGRIASGRLVMGALCAVLFLLALVNYFNVTLTGLAVRRKEFAVLESVGMTKGQLRKMLTLEGFFCSLAASLAVLTAGNGVLYLLGRLIKAKIAWFVFEYPLRELMFCEAALFAVCMILPAAVYRISEKGTVSERLRMYTD